MTDTPRQPAAAAIKLTPILEGEAIANTWKSPNTEMRLKYLASERGCHYHRDAASMVRAYNGSVALGPGATEAAVKSFAASVDPSINLAT